MSERVLKTPLSTAMIEKLTMDNKQIAPSKYYDIIS